MVIAVKQSLPRILLALVALTSAMLAQAGPLPLWELEGTKNRVMLMGSVHFLRPSDYPLREGLRAAYETADTLIMEIDMSTLDQMAAQQVVAELGIDPDGRGLKELLGAHSYKQADAKAADLGIPLAMLERFEPWFAALSITQLRVAQLGFDPAWGIEAMLTRRALQENKPIEGLETIEQQLGFMDRLDAHTQEKFLLQSLDDAAKVQDEIEAMVDAWSTGDVHALEESLLQGLQDAPALYDAILVQRNRNWVASIQRLMNESPNYLVIVGAMHLVGDDSVLAMLADEGVSSRQLSDDNFVK